MSEWGINVWAAQVIIYQASDTFLSSKSFIFKVRVPMQQIKQTSIASIFLSQKYSRYLLSVPRSELKQFLRKRSSKRPVSSEQQVTSKDKQPHLNWGTSLLNIRARARLYQLRAKGNTWWIIKKFSFLLCLPSRPSYWGPYEMFSLGRRFFLENFTLGDTCK